MDTRANITTCGCVITAPVGEGDVAFVDNRRVLHGRREFDPSTGLRYIRTCYGEREELLSSIRLLERVRAARQIPSSKM